MVCFKLVTLLYLLGLLIPTVYSAGSLFTVQGVGTLPYYSPNFSYLFYSDSKGLFIAWDIGKQKQFWNTTLKGKVTKLGQGSTCNKDNSGVAVILEGGSVVCLSGVDGSVLWTSGTTIKPPPKGRPAPALNLTAGIMGWGGGGSVNLVDPATGDLQASVRLSGDIQCQPQLVNTSDSKGKYILSIAAQMEGGGVDQQGVSDKKLFQQYDNIQGNISGCLAIDNDAFRGAQNIYTTSKEGFFTALNPNTLKRWYVDNETQSDPPVTITNQLVAYKGFDGQTVVIGATNASKVRSYSDNGEGISILGDWDAGGEVKVGMALTTTNQQVYLHVITVGGKVSTFEINQGLLKKSYDFQIPGNRNYTQFPIVAINKRFFVTSDNGDTDGVNFDGVNPEQPSQKRSPNSPGLWAGIAIAAVAFLAILLFAIFKLKRKIKNKKTKKLEEEFQKQQEKKERELEDKENQEGDDNLEKNTYAGATRDFNIDTKTARTRITDDLETQNTKNYSTYNNKNRNLDSKDFNNSTYTDGYHKDRKFNLSSKKNKLNSDSETEFEHEKPKSKRDLNTIQSSTNSINLRGDNENGQVFGEKKTTPNRSSQRSDRNLLSNEMGTEVTGPDKHQILKSLESENKSELERRRKTQTQDSQNLDNFDQLEGLNDVNTKGTLKSVDTQKTRESPKSKEGKQEVGKGKKIQDRDLDFETPQLKFGRGGSKHHDTFEFQTENSRNKSLQREDNPPPSTYEQMLKEQALREYRSQNRSSSSIDYLKDQRTNTRRSSSRQGGFDRPGYDRNGYDRSIYERSGYDRPGQDMYRPNTAYQRSDSAELMRYGSRPYSQGYGHPEYRQPSPPVHYGHPYGPPGPPPNQSGFYPEPPHGPPPDPRGYYHSGPMPPPYMYDRPYPYGY